MPSGRRRKTQKWEVLLLIDEINLSAHQLTLRGKFNLRFKEKLRTH